MANDKRFNAKNGLSVGATPVNVIDANGSITANTLTVGGASINTTSYSGTANNASNLNGQPASFYTNASNITTGTLPYAQIPANIVNTTAAFTYSGVQTYNANVVIGSTGEIVINSAAGISANGTFGSAGQMLTSNGTAVYWSTPQIGDITAVTAGSGLTGGGTSGDLTINIGAGTGITVNADDIAVNAAYIATITANAATYSNTIIVADTRNTATTPETASSPQVRFDFKTNATDGLSDGGLYFGEMTFRPYGSTTDWSGGPAHQLGFTSNNNVYHRSGTSTTWGSWARLYKEGTVLAAGNTTITGFANVSTTLQVGANTTVGGDVIVSSTYPRIWLNDTTNNSDFSIINSDGNLSVYDDTNGAHRFWIAANGNIGVGVTSPTQKLQVAGSIYIGAENEGLIVDASGGARVGFMKLAGHEAVISRVAGQDFGIARSADADIKNPSITYDIYVDGSGNTGIGTTSTTQKLVVSGTGAATTDFRAPVFYDSDNTAYYVDPSNTSWSGSFAGNLAFPNNTNAGIRNAAADAWLWVDDSSGNFYIKNSNGGFYGDFTNYNFRSTASASWAYMDANFFQHNTQLRAPIFYDSDNTSYYIDPFSISNIYRMHSDGIYSNQFLVGTTNFADVVNGSTWYGMGRTNSDLLGGGGNTVQVAGYYGLRMRTANATLDMYTSYTQASGSLRAPLFYDSNDTTYYLDPAGDAVLNNTYVNRYFQRNSGVPTNNLGTPTVTEMALFQEQFDNKTAFYPIANIKFYTSTDGNTWTEYTGFSDTEKRKFVGGNATSGINIPNGTPYFRIEILNNGAYVFLDALYMYWSGNSHSTTVKIRALRADNTWVQWTNSSTSISSWPGHMYLPFNSIPFIDIPGSTSHYKTVHIDFQPTWSTGIYASNVINLFNMQVWGGYPASKRTIFSVDELKNTTFPGDVKATLFYDTDNTSYYIDPASGSVLSGATILSTNPVLNLRDSDSTGAAQIGYISFRDNANEERAWFGYGSASDTIFYMRNSVGYNYLFADYTLASGSVRSPLFYDSNDTSRYVDPNDVTIINDISARRIGINNTTGNNGYGISLYGGYTGGEPTYGLMFQQTGTFGTYGQVSGDWATYFNMNDNNARGWIFRKATIGNVASISAGGEATFGTSVRTPVYYDSDNTAYYANPAGTSIMSAVTFDDLVRISTGSVAVNASLTKGLFFDGNYADGRYRHRFRKQDPGGGVALYLDYSAGTADSYVNLMKFGPTGADGAYLSVYGIINTNTDMRAPIYYDSDNTGYFVNPATSSLLYNATLNGTYFRASPGEYGYNFLPTADGTSAGGGWARSLNFVDGGGATNRISFGAYGGVNSIDYGYMGYGSDPTNFNGSVYLRLYAGNFTLASGSVRSPVFYDSDNTAYFLDAASSSTSLFTAGLLRTYGWVQAGYLSGGVGMITNDGYGNANITWNHISGTPEQNGNAARITVNTDETSGAYMNFQIKSNVTSGVAVSLTSAMIAYETYTQINNSTRSPIYYDSDNTAFYFDGASTTNINTLTGNGKEIFNTGDTYLRINQSSAFSSGTWFGGTLVRVDGFYAGSNGGTTTSRVAILSGSYNGSNVITLDGSTGLITSSGTGLNGGLRLTNPTGARDFRVIQKDGGYFAITDETAGAERLTINSSGLVQAVSDLSAGGSLFVGSGNASYIYMNDADNGQRVIHNNSDRIGFLTQAGAWGSWCEDSGQWTSENSLRAPILYDHNDTGYYLDINGSNVSNINTIIAGLAYFRSNPGSGVYSGAASSPPLQAYSNDGGAAYMSFHRAGAYAVNFGLDPDNYLRIGGWSAGAGRWVLDMSGNNWAVGSFRAPIFYDSDNTGYYIDGSSVSKLSSLIIGGNEAYIYESATNYLSVRTGATGAFRYFRFDTNGYLYGLNGGFIAEAGDIRAPVFYDQDNTGYYLNPASTSVLYNMNLINLRCRFDRSWENYPGIAVLNTTDQGPQGEFRIHGLAGDNGGDYAVTLRVDGAGVFLGDFYAPIYYDYNNSAYYLNPNSDSVLYRTSTYLAGKYVTTDWADGFRNTPTQSYNFHGDVSSGGPAGTWWFYESMRHSNGANYWGTQIAWGWEDNANRLLQRNVTANSFSGWVEYLNTSDRTYSGNLYMTGSIRSTASDMRAPIFYDQDNTGYYVNPAATSYINALNVGPTAGGSSYVNINGYNAYGGTGFHGFMTIYNTYSSASNPYQYWRLNGSGGFEIVNSPYNAVLFTFTQGGDFTAAGNVTAYSDKRLKDNIAPINNALDKVLQLNGVTFTRIDKEDTTQRYAGLLAQDVEVVLPEAVQVNETMSYGEIMSVDYNATIALLVEAIKEQQLTIASQSAKINTLEAKLDQIIQKLEG